MAVNVYLNYNGNCREVVEFYAGVFGCEQPKFMTYGQAPSSKDFPPLTEEQKNLILYTELEIAGSKVMFSDTMPGMPFVQGNNITIAIGASEVDKIRGWFEGLKNGGTIIMELQKTFWSDCYGMLEDQFGITWQFNQGAAQ